MIPFFKIYHIKLLIIYKKKKKNSGQTLFVKQDLIMAIKVSIKITNHRAVKILKYNEILNIIIFYVVHLNYVKDIILKRSAD